MAAKVEVYGTTSCQKCVNVREMFDRNNIEYVDYLIDLMPLEKDEMIRRTGLKYYPQIFINDEYIGGEAELFKLEASGELHKLLGLKTGAE